MAAVAVAVAAEVVVVVVAASNRRAHNSRADPVRVDDAADAAVADGEIKSSQHQTAKFKILIPRAGA